MTVRAITVNNAKILSSDYPIKISTYYMIRIFSFFPGLFAGGLSN